MKTLTLLVALLACVTARADQMLLPVRHLSVHELCDALVRNPGLIPPGVTTLWPLDERDAVVAEGSAEAIARLRDIVTLLDQPAAHIAVQVGLVVVPAEGPDKFNPDLFTTPPQVPAATEGGRFRALVAAYREQGGEIILSRSYPEVLVRANAIKTVWLDADFAALADPDALAGGVMLSPRVTPDGSVGLVVSLVAALGEASECARFIQRAQIQATVGDGDSLLYGGHFLGEGDDRQEVVLVVIPRVVFSGSR